MSIGRLLKACGFIEIATPGVERTNEEKMRAASEALVPRFSIEDWPTTPRYDYHDVPATATMSFPDGLSSFAVLTLSMPLDPAYSAAYALADAIDQDLGYPRRRPGDLLFNDAQLDAFDKAGCTIENREDGGVTIHLPNSGFAIDGLPLMQMMSEPLHADDLFFRKHYMAPAEPREPGWQPDYLKHDPTKRHSRKRSRRR